ncbi:MAG: nucleotidyltransferase domain-containing protein [Thermoprotei archaeon]|nr:MAG: nucleotidyltransferase domain-containing protein [Thermoprotei archaeon]HDD64354.1 nucleotidyltransferase domain-containing protein [Thermoprotei archaeon]
MRESSNTAEVRFFKLDYRRVTEELKGYAERAINRGALAVILVGSLARGDYTAFSDADVVVIADNVPSRPMDRIKDFLDPTLSVDVEPRVYTRDEILEMARRGSKVVEEIASYGILLAGDRKIFEEIIKEFRRTS